VLAPAEVLGVESANNKIRLLNPAERVLFVAYCLPSDDFLCAAVTDQHGHLADNVIINLHVDQPTSQLRYKNRSQIFDAIQRLWLYIQSVMVMETRNWRLVINRVGKIGHGEFKAWSQILSKNNLRSYNNSFKGRDRGDGLVSAGLDSASSASNCRTCQQTAGTQEIPIILSACLLSMEAECNLRLFSSSNSSVDLASGLTKSKGSTKNSGVTQAQLLDDPSITHIVAFPISPDIMDAQHGGNQPGNADDENIFDDLNFNELMQDDENIDALMGNTEFGDGGMRDTTIDHQPMSIGYSVSTAPANDLPDWFWNTCPNKKRELPVHLKSALHINSSNIHDELSIGQKTGNETFHPLDDTATDALLKHIMKVHNALSWLNVDVANGTRQSCLPVHMQTLFRLQRSIETLHS
jgi:mediator of RNA polymerase II transcription subunit 13